MYILRRWHVACGTAARARSASSAPLTRPTWAGRRTNQAKRLRAREIQGRTQGVTKRGVQVKKARLWPIGTRVEQ